MTGQSKLPQELRDIWTDAYKYHAAIEPMGNSLDDWKRAYEMALGIIRKYNNHPLAMKLVLDVYEYAEHTRSGI